MHKKSGIDMTGMLMSHLLYRTTRQPEYEALRDTLKAWRSESVETQFNGRPVSILILKDPVTLMDN